MKALIDGDRIPYALGGATDENDQPLKWNFLKARVDSMIENTVEEAGATEYQIYLTDSPSNFRLKIATIKDYKGTRPTEKPFFFHKIRQYLVEEKEAYMCKNWEADDQMGIDQVKSVKLTAVGVDGYSETTPQTVICSVDKDMLTVPGNIYDPLNKKMHFITETQANQYFYKQLLTGDTVDNILGLHGIGAKSKHLKNIEEMQEEKEMLEYCSKMYTKYFGNFAGKFLTENACLLWILREEPRVTDLRRVATHPVVERFRELQK